MKVTYTKRERKGLELNNEGKKKGDKRFGIMQQRQLAQRERKKAWN
jgi:hypothetical protein